MTIWTFSYLVLCRIDGNIFATLTVARNIANNKESCSAFTDKYVPLKNNRRIKCYWNFCESIPEHYCHMNPSLSDWCNSYEHSATNGWKPDYYKSQPYQHPSKLQYCFYWPSVSSERWPVPEWTVSVSKSILQIALLMSLPIVLKWSWNTESNVQGVADVNGKHRIADKRFCLIEKYTGIFMTMNVAITSGQCQQIRDNSKKWTGAYTQRGWKIFDQTFERRRIVKV